MMTHTADLEVEVLELAELGRGELEKTGGLIGCGAGCLLVLLEGVRGDQDESGAGVDDAGSVRQDVGRRAESDRLVDAEEERSGRRVGN